jgi:polyphenol oxidase
MTELIEPVRFARAVRGVVAGFTRRRGGVSKGAYAELNVSLAVGDDAAAVGENRARAARAGGFELARAALASQVHGGEVRWIDAREDGFGVATQGPEADALATDAAQFALLVGAADCVPVYLAAADGRAIALAHAGWRGVLTDVVPRALDALRDRAGVRPSDVTYAFGPSIGLCCFAVGADVSSRFAARFPKGVVDGASRVDLTTAVSAQLAEAGVEGDAPRPPCTVCRSDDYFSHRASKGRPTGRGWAFMYRL